MTLGVLLMMCSGFAVVAIGLLMYPVLKDVNPRLAVWYPILRITEFAVSAACGAYLLVQSEVVLTTSCGSTSLPVRAASSSPTSSSPLGWCRDPSPSSVSWGTSRSPSACPSTSSGCWT